MAYNHNVPTPFYHLSVAQELLGHQILTPVLRSFLSEHRAAFYLGNTAPDVQVLSGQSREATHFYTIPLRDDAEPAWERMLAEHPGLKQATSLPAEQAVFLAGYLCHLQADQRWARQIFEPVFGPHQTWETFRRRLYLHNVLRAYLDKQVLEGLPDSIGYSLAGSQVSSWLPFVKDAYLVQWRDYLADQLQPGAVAQTVEVFARRQGLAVDAFYELIDSQFRMDEEIFSHMPIHQLRRYRNDLIDENLQLLLNYLPAKEGYG